MANTMRNIGFAEAFAAAARTATANGTGLDLTATVSAQHKPFNYVREFKAIVSCGTVSGTTPTLDLKVQDSDDDSTYADISGATFAQLTAAGREEIHFRTNKRYVRVVATIGGTTPSFTFSVVILGYERYD